MRNRSARTPVTFDLTITDLNHEGQGVGRVDGKTVFVRNALIGETVTAERTRKHKDFDEARAIAHHNFSPERVEPPCAHFGVCGGCQLQHLRTEAQIAHKHEQLVQNLQRIAKVTPERWLAPLQANTENYRRRARLTVKYVAPKNRVLVGFREADQPYVADLAKCLILQKPIDEYLLPLGELINKLSVKQKLPQIEVAVADNGIALVLRILQDLTPDDVVLLRKWAEDYGVYFYLQRGGPDTVMALSPKTTPAFYYTLPDGEKITFLPTDFIQIHGNLNDKMLQQALDLANIQGNERVLELFSGLGNFSLPLAKRVREVVTIEGDAGLVARAADNAKNNNIQNIQHHVADLFSDQEHADWWKGDCDLALLDPPRAGCREILPKLAAKNPQRIVYISCHPGTLARDLGILVHEHGYILEACGVMDMFPHTLHVESMAVLRRK